MKKDFEPGLEHVKKLHISAFRDGRSIYTEFSRKYGQKKAREICDTLLKASERDTQAVYEIKNKDYDISMLFSGGYDADIIRKACNWVYENKDFFGYEILEIGCDCGFMTTFLGSLFPDRHITSIERSQEGVEIAKRNVEKFGLTNIEFICNDVKNLTDRQFDTVFSMRTMQENGDKVEDNPYNELIEQSELYVGSKQKYADTLSALVKDGGTLVSIERISIDAMFLAWLTVTSKSGLFLEQHTQLKCKEVGKDKFFQAMIFKNDGEDSKHPLDVFKECVTKSIDQESSEYEGWEAKIMYELMGGRIILGYETIDTQHNAKSKIVLKYHKENDSCLLLYNNNNGNVKLLDLDVEDKEDAIKQIENMADEAKKYDFIKISKIE